mgnify:CR=1 FL=1
MMIRRSIIFGTTCAAVLALSSCKEDPNSPGVEYMPDMYRSPSLEYYGVHSIGADTFYNAYTVLLLFTFSKTDLNSPPQVGKLDKLIK